LAVENPIAEIANREIAPSTILDMPPMSCDAFGEAIRNGIAAKKTSARTRENTATTLFMLFRFS